MAILKMSKLWRRSCPRTPQTFPDGPTVTETRATPSFGELGTPMGEHKKGFFHWTLHLVDGRIDIVARQLELPNFPDV